MADSKETILYELKIEELRALRSLKDVKEAVNSLDRRTKPYKESVKELVRIETQLASIRKQRIQVNKNVEKSVKSLTKAQVQKKNAVGASTSATLELGRVLSDMPYGIRGVANNLQQLASNLFFMSKATDAATGKAVGFGGAISRLLGGLIGPAGILIAFQGVIALLDYFKVGMSSSKDETVEADKATKDFSSSLKSLEKTLIDSGVSQESYNGKIREYIALKKLEKKVEESILSTQAEINKKNEQFQKTKENDIKLEADLLKAKKDAAEQANKVYPDTAIGRQAKAQAVDYSITVEQIESKLRNNIIFRKKLEEDIVKLTKDGIDEITKLEKAKKKLAESEKGTLKYYKQQKSDLESIRQTTAKTSVDYIKQGIAIEKIQKLIEEIEGKGTKGGTAKISPFKIGKELELDVKSNEAILLSYSNKIQMQELKNAQAEELLNAKTAKEKDVIKRKFQEKFLRLQLDNELATLKLKKKTEKEVLEAKYKTFQEEAKLRFLAYEDSIKKNDKLSKAQKESLIDSARTDTSKLLSDSFEERNKELGEGGTLEKKYEKLFEVFHKFKKVRLDALGIGSQDEEDGSKPKELNQLQLYVDSYKQIMSGLTEFIGGEFDRQLTIEKNKTNILNKELNDRLINENLSAEQRKDIQKQIAQNDENLRVKQDAINKKKFKQTKAFNLSMALIDTLAGATQVLSDKELPSLAKIPMMVSIIGAGMAQVAAISRQKFQSSSANTPINTTAGGGAGATERAEPSFNIVGRSNDNLLINAIQAQFGKPLKAYVVSRDVTTQQQLDGMIVGQAGT